MPEQPQQLTSIRQIKKAKLKGLIKGKKTASGEWAASIDTEPKMSMFKAYGPGRMHEETSNPAVATFGRHNPIHQGHEAIFNKMDEIAKRNNGKKYIYTSHSQNEKNPLSAEDKVKYIKKVVPSAEVRSSSKESPTILHMASHLHGEGHDELHIVVGSDRAADFEKTLNRYNGVKGPHGFYNFKKITVHSVGRDPDAEGVEGLSATKMRKAAQENDHETFRSGLPDSIKKHSKDIMNKVRSGMSIKEAIESLGISMDELFEATALNRNWNRLSPSSKERVIQAYTSDEAPKPKSSFRKFNQSIKGRLNETGGAGDIGTDELVAKYKKDTPGEYEHNFKDAFNHYLNLIMKPENKGRPWEQIAGDVKKEYPNVLPIALNQKLRELIGGSDLELKYKIYDEENKNIKKLEKEDITFKKGPPSNISSPSNSNNEPSQSTYQDVKMPNVWDNTPSMFKPKMPKASNPFQSEDVDTSKIKPTEHLQNKLDAAKDTSYSAIDKIMRAVAHDYNLDVKELRSQWMKKFKKTPDDYVKEAFNYSRYMRNPNRAPAKPLSQKSLDILDKAADEIGKKAVPSQQAIQDRKTKTRADYEKEIPESADVSEAYGKGYKSKSLLKAMEKIKPGVGERMDKAAAALKQNAADYQAILDKEKKKEVSEDLRQWFKDKWVRMDTKGNIKGDCAREPGEGKPKCLPLAKARAMDKDKRAAAARRKRREDPVADRSGKGGKPVNVRTEEVDNPSKDQVTFGSYTTKHFDICPTAVKLYSNIQNKTDMVHLAVENMMLQDTLFRLEKQVTAIGYSDKDDIKKAEDIANLIMTNAKQMKLEKEHSYIRDTHLKAIKDLHTTNEEVEELQEKNKPTNPALWARAKSLARSKFDVYPSAYANGWAAKWYKSKGGGWRSTSEEVEIVTEISNELIGKVNKIRSLYGPKSKTSAAERTREKAVEKVRHSSKVGKVEENFMDGKNPQDKGDMARHGLKGKSISELKKIRSSKSASPRKKQLAHWYINMHKKD